eukprot:jgi/Phyca11/564729/estExt2_Genewise1.C_PHYCAscaffold_150533
MAVNRINKEIAKSLLVGFPHVPQGCVCKATLEEWNAYQETEDQEVRSSLMEWIEGEIFIVELSSPEHESFAVEFRAAITCQPGVRRYLMSHGAAYVSNHRANQPRYEPDESYGPRRRTGSQLPQGLASYSDWRTLVLEVGFARGWGEQRGFLDWKAQKWARVPGVRYVVCVLVTENMASAEYKMYTVQAGMRRLPAQNPQPIVAPRTEIRFDARALLGLEPGDPIPRDPSGVLFPDPLVV